MTLQGNIQVLYFPDVPSLEMRYMMCSKQVSDETIKKLNEAILSTIHLK